MDIMTLLSLVNTVFVVIGILLFVTMVFLIVNRKYRANRRESKDIVREKIRKRQVNIGSTQLRFFNLYLVPFVLSLAILAVISILFILMGSDNLSLIAWLISAFALGVTSGIIVGKRVLEPEQGHRDIQSHREAEKLATVDLSENRQVQIITETIIIPK